MIEEIVIYWRTGGPLMPALAAVSFAIWFYFLRARQALLDVVCMKNDFEDHLLTDLSKQPNEENIRRYKTLSGPLPHAVAETLRASQGTENPESVYDRFQQMYRDRIDRDVLLLSALTAAAPLLGLLGTVIGMVATFRAVSGQFGNTAVNVSAGISQALITTQCGLVVAIPGLFGISRLHRLIDQVRARWSECRIHIVCMLEDAGTGAWSG